MPTIKPRTVNDKPAPSSLDNPSPESTEIDPKATPVEPHDANAVPQTLSKTTGPEKPEAPGLKVETIGTQRVETRVVEPYLKEGEYVKFTAEAKEYIGRVHSVKCENDDPARPLFVTVRLVDDNLELNEIQVPVSKIIKVDKARIKRDEAKEEEDKRKVEEEKNLPINSAEPATTTKENLSSSNPNPSTSSDKPTKEERLLGDDKNIAPVSNP